MTSYGEQLPHSRDIKNTMSQQSSGASWSGLAMSQDQFFRIPWRWRSTQDCQRKNCLQMRRSGLVSYRTCSLLKTGLSGRHHQPMHLSNQSWWITITFCQLVTAKGWMNDKRRKCWDYITFWNKLSKNTTGCSLFLNNLSMTEDIESSKVTTTQQKVQWTVRQGKRCQLSDRAFSTSHFFSSHLSQK